MKYFLLFVLLASSAFAQNIPQIADTVNSDGSVTRVTTQTFSAADYQNLLNSQQAQLQTLQSNIATLNTQIGILTPQVNNSQTIAQQAQAIMTNTVSPVQTSTPILNK